MEASTLEELSQHFTDKLSRLTECVAIQACLESTDEDLKEESGQPLESLGQSLDQLSDMLTLLRSKCDNQRKTLASVQELKSKLSTLLKGVQYTRNNIPPHLPTVHTASSQQSQNGPSTVPTPAKSQPVVDAVSSTPNPVPTPVHRSVCGGGSTQDTRAVNHAAPPPPPPPPCPLLEYLTVDEFNQVPKYMKGRLSYQQVNTVIDELNKVFVAKYKLIRQKKSTMNDFNRKRYEALKKQETKETKGVYFVVERDITDWSGLKMSRETHSFLTILRHCGRIYEVRGDKLVRYALIEMY